MTDWLYVKTTVVAPNTKTSEGERDYLREFTSKAFGKDLIWPEDQAKAALSKYETPLSFYELAPLRPSVIGGPYALAEGEELHDEHGLPACGYLEERRLWGCKWGAFEPSAGPVHLLAVQPTRRVVTYEYQVANRYPAELWNRCATDFVDLSFMSTWVWPSERRGRSIHRYGEGYVMGAKCDITQGQQEGDAQWYARKKSWGDYFLDTHEDWVKEMCKA